MKTFTEECKVINLDYEYEGYEGDIKFAIITDYDEKTLKDLYPMEISKYSPFMCLSKEIGEVRAEYERNEDKFEKRKNRGSKYRYEDGETEIFHKEIIEEEFTVALELIEKKETENAFKEKILNEIKLKLTQKQYDCILAHYGEGKSEREIAATKCISCVAVHKHIKAGMKKIEKILNTELK